MDEASWVGILTGELAAGRPILYDGRSENSGGHSFVCDGKSNSTGDGAAWLTVTTVFQP